MTNPRPQWRFREMQPGEMNVDPIEGEFFTTEALRSVTDALVRESIQNSLDASAKEEPVTVRFTQYLNPPPGVDSDELRKIYIDGLSPHLDSRHSGLPETPASIEPLSFMTIEDFGTRGLQGDERQYDDLDDEIKKNDFFYFWRNIGRTKKELTDLGRWGLGKTVFQAASRINTFFGLTVRKDDGRALLMGQSVLKIRREFAEGSRLAFNVPVAVLKQSAGQVFHTGFSVFLERDEKLDKPEDHFIRQGITIPEVSSLRHKGIRAIVSISDNDLSAFLGDAENPAHTQWERNSKKFKSKYKLGPATLDFVKSSPRELVKILTQPKKGRDENLLKHIFSMPLEPVGNAEKPGKEISDKLNRPIGDGEIVELEPGSYLQLGAIKGGFRLSRRPKAAQVPRYITLWIAYEVRSGNPFKKYTPLDFDVSREPIRKIEGRRKEGQDCSLGA